MTTARSIILALLLQSITICGLFWLFGTEATIYNTPVWKTVLGLGGAIIMGFISGRLIIWSANDE